MNIKRKGRKAGRKAGRNEGNKEENKERRINGNTNNDLLYGRDEERKEGEKMDRKNRIKKE